MKKLFSIFFLILFCICEANAMTTISGRPAPGGVAVAGNTNYCNDANAQLCLYMNGNGTDETDRTANGYTMTDSASSPTISSTVPSGYSGTSRVFTTSTMLVCTDENCPNLNINGAGVKISISAWVYATTVPGSGSVWLIAGKYYSASNQRQYMIGTTGTGSSQFKFTFALSTNGTSATLVHSTTTTYAANTWYHVVGVSDGTDLRVYVNGSLDCTPVSHTSGIFNGSEAFKVVSDHYTNGAGYIDEVGVWSRALSSTEVADIYNNGITGNKGGSD